MIMPARQSRATWVPSQSLGTSVRTVSLDPWLVGSNRVDRSPLAQNACLVRPSVIPITAFANRDSDDIPVLDRVWWVLVIWLV
jgi:hypothetical protein